MVIDQRDPDEANRKIFTEKDGEYVDYKEEKDAEKTVKFTSLWSTKL